MRWTTTSLMGAAVVMGLGLGMAGCDTIAGATQSPRPPKKIYASTCGYCHGHNVGPLILGRNLPREAVIGFVRRGQGAMPAFRPTEITDEELESLAAWIEASKADPKERGQ